MVLASGLSLYHSKRWVFTAPVLCGGFYRLWGHLGNWVFTKFKFKGKSFRWHRRCRSFILRFGHSHLTMLPFPAFIRVKKKGRMKLLFFGSSLSELSIFLSAAIAWRPMNIYHGRGLRLARQQVYRKAGKVSAYR
jgi:ribosomal protein L6P/L9E